MTAAKFRTLLFACMLVPQALSANPHVDAIVDALKTQGYNRIEISRTMLGRHRIVATSPDVGREIVVYGGTGAILRDYSFDIDANASDADDADWTDEDPVLPDPDKEHDLWSDAPLEDLFVDPTGDDSYDEDAFSDDPGWEHEADDYDEGDYDDAGDDGGTEEW